MLFDNTAKSFSRVCKFLERQSLHRHRGGHGHDLFGLGGQLVLKDLAKESQQLRLQDVVVRGLLHPLRGATNGFH